MDRRLYPDSFHSVQPFKVLLSGCQSLLFIHDHFCWREEIENKKLPSFYSIYPCDFSEPPYQKKGRNCGRVFKGQKRKFAAGTLENWAKNIPKISLHWVGI